MVLVNANVLIKIVLNHGVQGRMISVDNFFVFLRLLAHLHLSRRLIGELIVYPWSVVRRRLSTMLKHLLLRNRWADQSQILCGASLGRGNDILFAASGSHDQDGRHAHIW